MGNKTKTGKKFRHKKNKKITNSNIHPFLRDDDLTEFDYNRIRAPHLLHTLSNLIIQGNLKFTPEYYYKEQSGSEDAKLSENFEVFHIKQIILIERIRDAGLPLSYYPKNVKEKPVFLSTNLIQKLQQTSKNLFRLINLPKVWIMSDLLGY